MTLGTLGKRVQNIFFILLFVIFFVLVAKLFSPFFNVILWSVLFFIFFNPMYRAILKHVNPSSRGFMLKKQFLSGTFAILSVLVIIIPIVFLGIELSRQVIDFANYMNGYFAEHGQMRIDAQNPIVAFISQLSGGRFDLSNLDIKKELLLFLERSANTIFTLSTSVVKNVGGFAINLVFMIFTLFFFYLDGDYLLDLFMKAIPIDKSYMQDFVSKFKETSKHLIQGYFLVSLIQGCIAFIIFTLFGVKNALLLSVVLYFCSFIPMIGASAVWLPIGLIRIFQGELFLGVFFLLVSGFFISLLDNFLRPFFLKDRIKVHPLLIFFSILGGVRAFGFNGLILGPMILMLFFTALDIFIRIYKTDRFDKKGSAESGEESP